MIVLHRLGEISSRPSKLLYLACPVYAFGMETLSSSTTKYPWLLPVVLAGAFYLVGQYMYGQYASPITHDLTVSGVGELETKPDIARITLGVTTGPQTTAKQANDLLSQKVTAVLTAVEAAGVAKDDIKTTNLSINPIYDYPDGRQILRGFDANEQVEIKIRNLDNVGNIISRTTTEGVNQVGGIAFTVDKPEELQKQAEAKAIENAKEKAENLAKTLGVRLKGIKFYSSSVAVPGSPEPFLRTDLGGAGGGGSVPVSSGTQTITANVNITYEIK